MIEDIAPEKLGQAIGAVFVEVKVFYSTYLLNPILMQYNSNPVKSAGGNAHDDTKDKV